MKRHIYNSIREALDERRRLATETDRAPDSPDFGQRCERINELDQLILSGDVKDATPQDLCLRAQHALDLLDLSEDETAVGELDILPVHALRASLAHLAILVEGCPR